ncbi:MAG: CarD family transcriptional regulator [Hydrotalea sp.]|nr:CarD family transcriptional regulator [Hydrotalea sp.]
MTKAKVANKILDRKSLAKHLAGAGKNMGAGRGGSNGRGMSSGFRRAPLKKEDLKRGPIDPTLETQDLTRANLQDGSLVVYPSHGVGKVLRIEQRDVGGGMTVELVVVNFDMEKLTLSLPIEKAKKDGLRTLLSKTQMEQVLKILRGKGKIKRIMWAKRAQEYEAKINSGDASLVAEVVRDLYRPPSKPEQSFSEKQLFQIAVERLAREISAIETLDLPAATEKVHGILHRANA